MEGKGWVVWRGARPLIGSVVGVGIFGLPYAFSRAGFGIGLLELLLIGGLNLVVLFLYADLVLLENNHGRFIHVVGSRLGPFGKVLSNFVFFASHFGALIAYILVGGTFGYTVLSPLFGGTPSVYQFLFWFFGSLMMLGGLFFVARLQAYIIPLFFILIALLSFFSLPHIEWNNLLVLHPENSLLPLGVILFAFSGLSAIPEMRDVLQREQSNLRKSVFLGTAVAALLYTFFTLVIVGALDGEVQEQAIDGLGAVVGPVVVTIGSLLGLCTVSSAFVTIGVAMTNSLLYDNRMRYTHAWIFVVGIPLIFFVIGARDFIGVIGFTGGVMSSLLGMMLVLAYEKARLSNELPKRALAVPQWLVALSFMMFVAMFALTIADIIS